MTCFSITLVTTGSIDIGLYPDVMFLFLPGFGTGVTQASFHSFGILPVESERLMRFESARAVLQAVCFNIFADTPSHPVDLLVSRVVNRSYTDSSVDNIIVVLDNFQLVDLVLGHLEGLSKVGNHN